MKRLAVILSLALALTATASLPFTVNTNVMVIVGGDSFNVDIAGNGQDIWDLANLQLMDPLHVYRGRYDGQSGQSINGMIKVNMPFTGLPLAGSMHGTNIVWFWDFASGNGGQTGNTNYYETNGEWAANFPLTFWMYAGVPTNDFPWATNQIYHTFFGDSTYLGPAFGNDTVIKYSLAFSNVAGRHGFLYVDSPLHTSFETNVFNTNAPLATNLYFPVGLGGIQNSHPQRRALQFVRSLQDSAQLGLDTNVWSWVQDWTSSTIASTSTNQCSLGTPTVTASSWSAPIKLNRMWGPTEIPDSAHTNDVSDTWSVFLAMTNFVKELVVFSNAPAGTFVWKLDGEPVQTNLSVNGFLTNNFFQTPRGPWHRQGMLLVDGFRILRDINTTNAADSSGQTYMRNFGSQAGARFPTNQGTTLYTAAMLPVETAMESVDVTNFNNAQQTLHTLTVSKVLLGASITNTSPTNAFNTPVLLDGSGSTSVSNYIWSQTAGPATLDFVGQGMPKIMVISCTNAGDYTFQLAVTDNSTYATSSIVVTFIAPTGTTNYVDGTLTANTATYSVANRNNAGTDGNGFTNIQNAVGAAHAGDLVSIRGGVYSVGIVGSALINQYTINATNSGTATAPIRIEAYNGEYVRLGGWGFSDADTNSDGKADGVISNTAYRQTLVFVSPGANYIQFRGLDLSNAQNAAMSIEGNFCFAQEISAHDSWTAGVSISKDQLATNGTVQGDVLRYVEAYNNRHFAGILIGLATQQTFGFIKDCAVVDCLSYWNGYQPNGTRVLPSGNDSQGGGNSGGFWTTKYFADNAVFFPTNGIPNYGINLYFIRNEAWNNSDDGFAFDHSESLIAENRSLFNGPTGAMGYKMLRYIPNFSFRGNIAYGNQARGFELRADTNSFIKVFNNTSVKNVGYGFWIAGVDATTLLFETNNVAAFDGQTDWPNGIAPNWGADGFNVPAAYKGDPKFASTNIVIPGTGSFTNGVTVKQKHDYIDALVTAALTPTTNSPLLRAALFIPSYHCPTADNDAVNPMPLAAIGRHWLTNTPDMGALSVLSTNITIPAPPTLGRFGVHR